MSEPPLHGASVDGTVMLDIGGDIGALIVHTGEDLLGVEIDISPADETAEDVFAREHPHVHEHGDDDGHTHDHTHSHDYSHSHDHDGPPRTHVQVRERRGPAGVRYAAIYPGLREGRYNVHGTDGTVADTVAVTGGEVVELDWR